MFSSRTVYVLKLLHLSICNGPPPTRIVVLRGEVGELGLARETKTFDVFGQLVRT
jgi:hypothetical protein